MLIFFMVLVVAPGFVPGLPLVCPGHLVLFTSCSCTLAPRLWQNDVYPSQPCTFGFSGLPWSWWWSLAFVLVCLWFALGTSCYAFLAVAPLPPGYAKMMFILANLAYLVFLIIPWSWWLSFAFFMVCFRFVLGTKELGLISGWHCPPTTWTLYRRSKNDNFY